MASGGKSVYQNLLCLIKDKAPRLHNVISMVCIEGTFRNDKFANTFLMPNDKLIKHLEKLVDTDKDKEVIEILRSMILKGHLSKSEFKKDAVIGTIQYGKRVLADPAAVGKLLNQTSDKIVNIRTNAIVSIVYEYAGDVPPETTEGVETRPVPVVAGGMHIVKNEDFEAVKNFSDKLVIHGDKKATLCNFFKAVSAGLAYLKEADIERFHKAKFYLAANPVVAWYFMTMQGCEYALLKPQEVKKIQLQLVSEEVIREAEHSNHYKFNNELMQELLRLRKEMIDNTDKGHIAQGIKAIYIKMLPKFIDAGVFIKDIPIDLKIRMDELRFMHENSVNSFDEIEKAITDLSFTKNYYDAKSCITIADEEFLNMAVQPKELIASLHEAYIRSIYLVYMPLTEEVEAKLSKLLETRCGGAITGGNPASINTVVFSGGAARRALVKIARPHDLKALVRLLSAKEREELKQLL